VSVKAVALPTEEEFMAFGGRGHKQSILCSGYYIYLLF
jgi:hypothetical protein